MGTALMLFGGLLLALAGMLCLAKLVLEPEEFRLFLGLFAPGVLLACLLFWGAGSARHCAPAALPGLGDGRRAPYAAGGLSLCRMVPLLL